ncbi:MAG: TldD/PmbA family protein [Proteobacteria bacterium]|nr:TldD/PmbA family protein [Pseudomonadota bacterium]
MNTQETLEKSRRQLEGAANDVLDYGRTSGADRVKVAVSASIERKLMIENKEFTLANTLESQKVGILVHKDQKKSSSTLNTCHIQTLKKSVDDALSLARFSVADENLTMADSLTAPQAKPLPFMFDGKLAETDLGTLQEFSQTVLSRLTRDPRVSLDKCEFSVSASWHGMYNSLGVSQSESQTALGWSFFGMAVDGEEVSGFDYDGRHSYKVDGALDLALNDADLFCEKVLSNLRPRKAPSYKGLVLFSPRAVQEILLDTILYHASGTAVMDGKSIWSKHIGRQVVNSLLTISDHPHDERFTGATAFDGDGVPTRHHTIVDKGILSMHLHDCYSAKKTGQKTNGMAGGPFALIVNRGETDLKAMKSARSDLLIVDRFSGNIDSIKGDFSGVAKSSRLLHAGTDVGAVTETMIAGNLFELLNDIQAVSCHQELVSGGMLLPWILCDQVSVTGG